MMNGTKLSAIAICLAFIGGNVEAKPVGSDPLDFSYRISGDHKVRPTLVFNDGVDTYVQPSLDADGDAAIKGVEFERQGPYLVIRGVASTFKIFSKKAGVATVSYLGAVEAPAKPTTTAPIQTAPVLEVKPAQPQQTAVVESRKPAQVASEATAQSKAVTPAAKIGVAAPSSAPTPVAAAAPVSMDPKPREISPETKERLAALRAEADREVCRATVQTKESAFVVGFAGKSVVLSEAAIKSLKSAIGSTSDIQSIRGHAEAANDDEKIAAARAKTIFDALKKFGIAGDKISIGTRQETGIGTELRIVHGKVLDCEVAPGTINIIAPDRQNVSIAADADAHDVLAKLAGAVGLTFRQEGHPTSKVNLKVTQKNRPLLLVLESIGNNLGGSADLIYRDSEIVLRYRSQQ